MFCEGNTVEAYVRDLLCGPQPERPRAVTELPVPYVTPGLAPRGAGWHFGPAAALPRQVQGVFVESYVRDALIHLNPAIAAQPERADEVLAAWIADRRVTSPARAMNELVVRDWRRPVPGTYWPSRVARCWRWPVPGTYWPGCAAAM